jgi:RNA polymerase sigma factor for flagellar operon FliA
VQANELWTSYRAGDDAARATLLGQHLGLVHFVARQLSRKLSSDVDFDELLSAGTLGLIGALESFDATRGLAFSTFAAPRIRGAILDELRKLDHASRSVRRKGREIAAASEELMRALGRAPSERELAGRLDIGVPELWRWRRDVEDAVLVPLDGTAGDRDTIALSPADTLSDERPGIDRLIEREQDVEVLKSALAALNEQQRTVLTLYYYEELKLNEIAIVLGVTESRVSQIRTKALATLRGAMATLFDAVA